MRSCSSVSSLILQEEDWYLEESSCGSKIRRLRFLELSLRRLEGYFELLGWILVARMTWVVRLGREARNLMELVTKEVEPSVWFILAGVQKRILEGVGVVDIYSKIGGNRENI